LLHRRALTERPSGGYLMKLKTETNTVAIERRVMAVAATKLNQTHHHLSVDFEHGQWWVSCVDCGAQWSVVDAEGGTSLDGFDLEQVSDGDESCL
jgi:hypothetical protein